MKKNDVFDHLSGMAKRAQEADAQRIKDDYGKLSDALDVVEKILSRRQSNETLGAAERRLGSLLGSVKTRLSITKAIGA